MMRLIRLVISLQVFLLVLPKNTVALSCYRCTSYSRPNIDLNFSVTCKNPVEEDREHKCEAAFCYRSSVKISDLGDAIVVVTRGCANSDRAAYLTTHTNGFDWIVSICNNSDYCNSAMFTQTSAAGPVVVTPSLSGSQLLQMSLWLILVLFAFLFASSALVN